MTYNYKIDAGVSICPFFIQKWLGDRVGYLGFVVDFRGK